MKESYEILKTEALVLQSIINDIQIYLRSEHPQGAGKYAGRLEQVEIRVLALLAAIDSNSA